MNNLTVCTLIDLPNNAPPEVLRCNTLLLDTIRVGFPTATIKVYLKSSQSHKLINHPQPHGKETRCGETYVIVRDEFTHSEWVEYILGREEHQNGGLVILDPDMVFYDNLEHLHFNPFVLLAGNYIPRHYVLEAKVISMSRLHSSFLWIPDVNKLRLKMHMACDIKNNTNVGSYIPCNFWKPTVQYIQGVPRFWDCGANLFQMLRAEEYHMFGTSELSSYTHLLGANWRWKMYGKDSLEWYTNVLAQYPDGLKNLWIKQQDYFTKQSGVAKQILT